MDSMDEQTARTLARRAAPYGLAVLPDTHAHEYTDPQHEAAVQNEWQRTCEEHGARILGTRDVPTEPIWVQLDGVNWLLGPFGQAERWAPAWVFHRLRSLQGANVPFQHWLWGEEEPQWPNLRPLPERDTNRLTSGAAPLARPRDPILIGVIPTAPNRGMWALVGRWFH